ncbi:MAG: AMP-binding protein, partial [Candidatus Krumholzibacteria bacterium]|nr:AMP-binding protein [Candidatus Krumholzibacteria bacterium]
MSHHEELLAPGTMGTLKIGTLPDLYEYAMRTYGRSVYMRKHHPWGYQSITYQEFGALVSYIGAGLIDRGLSRGDRVVLIADNCPEWVLVYAAVTSCGAAIVPLEPRMPQNEIHHLLIHSEASFIVASPQIWGDSISGMNLGGVTAIVIGEAQDAAGAASLSGIMAAGREKITGGDTAFFNARSRTAPDDIAAISYTSGTTGQPKGAVLLHRNLLADLEAVHGRLVVRSSDVFLSILPLHHTFASMTDMLVPLLRGAALAFARSLKPRIILEDIRTEKVTVFAGVPLLYEHIARLLPPGRAGGGGKPGFLGKIAAVFRRLLRLVRRGRPAPEGSPAGVLAQIRFCISGAAALRPDVERILSGAGLKVLQGYGLTEASPVVSVNPLDRPRRGTVGPALPGIEVSIEAPDADGVGEIVVRGPNVMKEYFKNPGATSAALRGGALRTGDLGRIDRDGYLTIVGRRKSVIVTSGGKNVYPDELEALLVASPMILECAVLPVKDGKGNARPGAVVVPDYEALATVPGVQGPGSEERIRDIIAAEIREACAPLPDYKH